MDASASRLTPLQKSILAAFFAKTDRFFLTGGAALAGFYFGHRDTKDLDLFGEAVVDILEGEEVLLSTARELGAQATELRRSGDFRRYTIVLGDQRTLVDLVIDRVAQLERQKQRFGVVRVDSLREIGANKLCALLDRAEPRDLVDLERILTIELLPDLVRDAQQKHMSADPATLAFALGSLPVAASAVLPAGVTHDEVVAFRERLVAELMELALPQEA